METKINDTHQLSMIKLRQELRKSSLLRRISISHDVKQGHIPYYDIPVGNEAFVLIDVNQHNIDANLDNRFKIKRPAQIDDVKPEHQRVFLGRVTIKSETADNLCKIENEIAVNMLFHACTGSGNIVRGELYSIFEKAIETIDSYDLQPTTIICNTNARLLAGLEQQNIISHDSIPPGIIFMMTDPEYAMYTSVFIDASRDFGTDGMFYEQLGVSVVNADAICMMILNE